MIRRVLLVGLLVVLALLGAGDFAARAWAQSRVGDELRTSLDLSRRPDVSLGGFPFLWHAAQGSFSSVHVRAEDVVARGVPFAAIDVTLTGIRFSTRRLVSGHSTTIAADGGRGTASLGGDGITTLLRDQGVPVTVQLSGGEVTLTSERAPGRATGTVALEGGGLVIRSAELGAAYRIDLPELAPGIRFTSARVVGSAAVLGLALDRVRIRV